MVHRCYSFSPHLLPQKLWVLAEANTGGLDWGVMVLLQRLKKSSDSWFEGLDPLLGIIQITFKVRKKFNLWSDQHVGVLDFLCSGDHGLPGIF